MMRSNWTVCIGMSAAMALFLAAGFVLPAMLLFPVPIACYWVWRRDTLALGLLCCAMATPTLMTGSIALGLLFGVVAAWGLLLGLLARRGVTLGVSVTVLTLVLFAFLAVHSAVMWDSVRADWHTALQTQLDKFESAADEGVNRQVATMFTWLEENLAYLYFGMLASGVLLAVTAICSVMYRAFKLEAWYGTGNYRFMRMRTPEHLVWIAILLAALWFVDSRWPHDAIRFIAWNGALVLAAIYWLNGASILFYVFDMLKCRPIVPYIVLAGMVVMHIIYVLSIIGFFDTWLDFRRKALELALSRTKKNNGSSDE